MIALKIFAAFILGILISMAFPMLKASVDHGKMFRIKIYFEENKQRMIAGIFGSIVASGIILLTTSEAEMQTILFIETIIFASASPMSILQATMSKKPKRLEQ